MALKLLQPSLRPLGQFDLADDSAAITGGEIVKLNTDNTTVDSAAADSHQVGPFVGSAGSFQFVNFTAGTFQQGTLCGLADEGEAGYGTQFGTLIGGNAGKGFQVPTNMGATLSSSGAVVIGPETHTGSGKVTVWHAAGLYAVNAAATTSGATDIELVGQDAESSTDTVITLTANGFGTALPVNAPVFAHTNGKLYAGTGDVLDYRYRGGVISGGSVSSDQCAIYAGYLTDSSLVSTPAHLAGTADASAEEFAIYYLGNQGLI